MKALKIIQYRVGNNCYRGAFIGNTVKKIYNTLLAKSQKDYKFSFYKFRYSIMHLKGEKDALVFYEWSSGGSGGMSTLKIINSNGQILLSLVETSGDLKYRIFNDIISVIGLHMTYCMACGKMEEANFVWLNYKWRTNNLLFARYLLEN